jgi:hypothetical protein
MVRITVSQSTTMLQHYEPVTVTINQEQPNKITGRLKNIKSKIWKRILNKLKSRKNTKHSSRNKGNGQNVKTFTVGGRHIFRKRKQTK